MSVLGGFIDAFDERSRGKRLVVTLAFVDDSGAPEPDAAVLQRLRRGDTDAYAVLYGRHAGAARRLAGSLLGNAADVEDVVSEVFAAAFRAIAHGKGPADDFGPYVLSSVRRECARSWRRRARRRELPVDDVDVADDGNQDLEERAVLQQAFNALPAHLRQVLWMTEVERLSHAEVADRTASTSQAVAALAMRARKSLAEQYLAAHVAPTTPPECARVRRTLARTVRGTASGRQQRRVAAHLAGCRECAQAERQLHLVNRRLRTLAPPALAGALVVPRLVSLGLRGRLAAWLLGPAAAPLTAVTGLLVTGVALPAATTLAERQPVVASEVLDESVQEAGPAGSSRRSTSGVAGQNGSAADSEASSGSGDEAMGVDGAPSGSAGSECDDAGRQARRAHSCRERPRRRPRRSLRAQLPRRLAARRLHLTLGSTSASTQGSETSVRASVSMPISPPVRLAWGSTLAGSRFRRPACRLR